MSTPSLMNAPSSSLAHAPSQRVAPLVFYPHPIVNTMAAPGYATQYYYHYPWSVQATAPPPHAATAQGVTASGIPDGVAVITKNVSPKTENSKSPTSRKPSKTNQWPKTYFLLYITMSCHSLSSYIKHCMYDVILYCFIHDFSVFDATTNRFCLQIIFFARDHFYIPLLALYRINWFYTEFSFSFASYLYKLWEQLTVDLQCR